jgi:outer membrane immunogenic protein
MKRALFLGVSVLTLATGAAFAADLPARMPVKAPAYVPFYNWTGFYVGGNVGGVWSSGSGNTVAAGVPGTVSGSGSGVLGGIQAGYNWQTSNIVFGVETDIQGSSGRGSFTGINGGATTTGTARSPWFGTIRGRVGYAADRWLFYVTGGGVYGQNRISGTTVPAGVAFDASANYWAWTVGGGVETALWDRWTAKLEYLYIGNPSNAPTPPLTTISSGNTNTNIVRVGLNYRF